MIEFASRTDPQIKLGRHDVVTDDSAQNYLVLRNKEPLNLDEHTMLDCIDYWSKRSPNTVCMRERAADGWSEISYKEFASRAVSYTHLTLPTILRV